MSRVLLMFFLGLFLLAGCSDNSNDKGVSSSAKELQVQRQFQQKAGLLLERMSTVLDGYQAFSGKLPVTLKDLDSGGYMFDSAYLAEILPEGTDVYLVLSSEKATTRIWLQQEGQQQVLSRTLVSQQLENLKAADLQALKSKWQEVAKVGRLTQVTL